MGQKAREGPALWRQSQPRPGVVYLKEDPQNTQREAAANKNMHGSAFQNRRGGWFWQNDGNFCNRQQATDFF